MKAQASNNSHAAPTCHRCKRPFRVMRIPTGGKGGAPRAFVRHVISFTVLIWSIPNKRLPVEVCDRCISHEEVIASYNIRPEGSAA